jgi:type IV fimbrial biogenesis protein FimT
MKPSLRQRGVTFVEIVVVVAIFGVAILSVLPDVSVSMGNARVRAASESLLSGLQRARVEALRRNERVTFFLMAAGPAAPLDNGCARSAAGLSWVVSAIDPTGACAADPSDTTDPRIKIKADGSHLADNVTLAAVDRTGTTSASAITFDSSGRITDADSIRYINLSHSSGNADMRRLRIEVTMGGVIRLCEPDIAASSTDARRCLYQPS